MKYFSVDMNLLLPLLTEDPTNVGDLTYIQKAIKSVVTSKDLSKQKDYISAVQYANKAVGLIEKLFESKKEQQPDYIVLQAPFYYFLASQILTYAENAIDVFGNLAPLPDDVLPLFSDDEEDEDEEQGDENQEALENQPDTVKDANHDDDEPRIEEEVKAFGQNEESKEEIKEKEKGADEITELCIDIQENLVACIEVVQNFLNTENQLEASKKARENVLNDLLIDAFYKLGELCFFQELYEPSIPYYGRVTELCS